MSTFHSCSCHLPNAYFGARLGAKCLMCIIELYIYTHDYNSVNFGCGYSTTCWNKLLPAVSLETWDTNPKFLFFFMSAVVGPRLSTLPPTDRIIESQNWE